MFQEKVGENAGVVWNALNGTEGKTFKEIKKESGLKEKDLYLALGWLLREGKVSVDAAEKDLFIKLV